MEKIEQIKNEIVEFWKKSMQYYGKEVSLPSNQHFEIDQILADDEVENEDGNEDEACYNYQIQYGFPSSGCVSLGFLWTNESGFSINSVSIYAPPVGHEFVVANFAPQAEFGGIGLSMHMGMDIGTEEHTSLEDIANNPNACKMLELAQEDLDGVEVLGDCRVAVDSKSKIIPCTTSSFSQKTGGSGKQM